MAVGWRVVYGGKTPPPGEVVRPDERLSWGRTVGFGAQHVIAMFGATFVFPVVMGLDPNLAIMMSGVATILFLLIVQNRVPSYLGTSASFVAAVAAIRAGGGGDDVVTGGILVAGLVLAVAGVLISVVGIRVIHQVFPPVVTGAVVMLIGFGLAYVVADVYWPQDRWVAVLTMAAVFLFTVVLPGFWSRIAILLGLGFGYLLSWLLDATAGPITRTVEGDTVSADRIDWGAVHGASWFGVPDLHAPSFEVSAILLCLPAVIALIAENTGHVKAVAEMTGDDLDPVIGRAIAADGIGTGVATSVGGSPTTTYAENIGVMAATRVYSTAAYYVAALVAILFGLCPKFGALVAATPGGVLGGITVVLYGMIGLLGAKIWVENRVDFSNPVNLVPVGAGIILAIGPVDHAITDDFVLGGIALGTIVVLLGYHLLRWLAPAHLRERHPAGGAAIIVGEPGVQAYDEQPAGTGDRGRHGGPAGTAEPPPDGTPDPPPGPR
jgi:uracil-xanthine permease